MDYNNLWENQEKLDKMTAIWKANQLSINMKAEAEKYTKLSELAYQNYISTVKNNVNYLSYLFRIQLAFKFLSEDTQKMDKRSSEYKELKTSFESLERFLSSEEVLGQPIRIVDFRFGGYESCYYEVSFNLKDSDISDKFSFTVPDISKLNTQNFGYAYEGKLALGVYEKEHYLNILQTSYDIDDIKKAFKERINV